LAEKAEKSGEKIYNGASASNDAHNLHEGSQTIKRSKILTLSSVHFPFHQHGLEEEGRIRRGIQGKTKNRQ